MLGRQPKPAPRPPGIIEAHPCDRVLPLNALGHLLSRATSLPILLLGFIIFPSLLNPNVQTYLCPWGKKAY